jgi:hypothetical protein
MRHLHRLPQTWLAALLIGVLALPATAAQKKLIRFGIDSPDAVWMQNHIENMEESPFDGTVFYLTTDAGRASGAIGDFSWGAFGTRQFSKEELQTSIDALKGTKFKKFTDNFARFSVTASRDLTDKTVVDWFDSWDAILHNSALAATTVKEGGQKGLLFDIEAYAGPLWDYKKQRDTSTKSYKEYAAQARLRGKQVMNAFQEAYPGITILLAEGYTLPYRDAWPWPYKAGPNSFPENSAHPDKLKHIPYGLLAPFLDGMADAAAPTTKIIDGGEGTYTHRTKADFARFRKGFSTGVLPMVGISPEKYRQTFKLGLATWIDVNWRQEYGWNGTDFTKNFWQPKDFQAALENALDESDEYVWLYSESLYFWGPSKNVPEPYWQAAVNAHRHATETTAR